MDSPCSPLPPKHRRILCREFLYLGSIALLALALGLGNNALRPTAGDLMPWEKQLPWLGTPEEVGP